MKDLYFVKTDENGYITYLTKTGTERDTIEFDFDETKNLSCYKVNDGVVSFDSEKEERINQKNSLLIEKFFQQDLYFRKNLMHESLQLHLD